MPSIFKQHNIIPKEESVKIPDESPRFIDDDMTYDDINYDFESSEIYNDGELPQDDGFQNINHKKGRFTPTVMTREDLKEYYQEELDQICSEEAEKAYSEALIRKKGELSECIRRVDSELEEMHKLQMKFAEKYAYELKYLAIEIAEKMIVQKISENDKILSRLVMKNVTDVKNSSWVNVEVSERLVNLVESIKREIEKPEYYGRVTLTPVAGRIDTVRVNAEEGTVVADISVQAKNLREAFKAEEKR